LVVSAPEDQALGLSAKHMANPGIDVTCPSRLPVVREDGRRERFRGFWQLAKAATGESASYIEVVGGRMDFPAGLAMAHERLNAMYGNN
jgi:hypothetical protein